MDTAKIKMPDEQRNGVAQIFEFLGVAQSQAREPAIKQPHGKVCSLAMAGCCQFQIWIADAPAFLYGEQPGPLKADGVAAVMAGEPFDFRSVVNRFPKDALHHAVIASVSNPAIGCQLERGQDTTLERMKKAFWCSGNAGRCGLHF